MKKKKPKTLKAGDLPMGVWIATGLLDIFSALVLLALILLGTMVVVTMADIAFGRGGTGQDIVAVPLIVAVGFIMYTLLASSMWLTRYMRAIHFRGAPSRAPLLPSKRLITHAQPVLYFVNCLSLLGLACWVGNWVWNLMWIATAALCFFLLYLLRRKSAG